MPLEVRERLSLRESKASALSQRLGEHTDEVLGAVLNIGVSELEALRSANVI
jgi:hypothetical protein